MDLSLVIVIVCAVLAVALVVIYLVFGRSEANFTFDIGGAAPRASGGSDSPPRRRPPRASSGSASGWAPSLASCSRACGRCSSSRRRTMPSRPSRTVGAPSTPRRPAAASRPQWARDRGQPREPDRRGRGRRRGRRGRGAAARQPHRHARPGRAPQAPGHHRRLQSPRTVSVDVSRRVVAFIGEHPEAFPGVSVQQRTQRSLPLRLARGSRGRLCRHRHRGSARAERAVRGRVGCPIALGTWWASRAWS